MVFLFQNLSDEKLFLNNLISVNMFGHRLGPESYKIIVYTIFRFKIIFFGPIISP